MMAEVKLRPILLDSIHLSAIAVLIVLSVSLRLPCNLVGFFLSDWCIGLSLSSSTSTEFHGYIVLISSKHIQVRMTTWSMVHLN